MELRYCLLSRIAKSNTNVVDSVIDNIAPVDFSWKGARCAGRRITRGPREFPNTAGHSREHNHENARYAAHVRHLKHCERSRCVGALETKFERCPANRARRDGPDEQTRNHKDPADPIGGPLAAWRKGEAAEQRAVSVAFGNK
ncbi:MAG: hypothetical protein BJ554DRAFT_8210 [Olpidium bornovanus]|uniref:Uncharacterized protein n=1 Tax=Olpidium bornovanus TaxID=278681 RepID=A0A8H7ZUU3_9FUNG|nr:MAG: hypothetical protein BJ554DRAFT_8210 [Olpidium bornovanus]